MTTIDTTDRRAKSPTAGDWMKRNLFSSPANTVITIVSAALIVVAVVFVIVRVVTTDYTIVRSTLRIFMIGNEIPNDELWRLWVAGIGLAATVGFVGGGMARNSFQIAVETDANPQPDNIVDFLRRFWVLFAIMFFFTAFARTWSPFVLAVLVIVGLVLGRLAGWRAPAAVRSRLAYITALLILTFMMVVAGTSGLGGVCVGLVLFLWVGREARQRLEASAAEPIDSVSTDEAHPEATAAATFVAGVAYSPVVVWLASRVAAFLEDRISLFGPREFVMVVVGTLIAYLAIVSVIARHNVLARPATRSLMVRRLTSAVISIVALPLVLWLAGRVGDALEERIGLFGPLERLYVIVGAAILYLVPLAVAIAKQGDTAPAIKSLLVRRWAALSIDAFNAMVLVLAARLVAGFLRDNITLFGGREEVMVIAGTAIGYFVYCAAQLRGDGTYGQQAFGTRVVDPGTTGSVSFGSALVYVLTTVVGTAAAGVGMLLALIGPSHRSLQERSTRASVVSTRPEITKLAPYAGLAVGAVAYAGISRLGIDGYGWGNWGGLMVNIFAAIVGVTLGMPLGILLAVGRRSELPVIKSASVLFIEFVRGVPLLSLLLFSKLMLPLFLPQEWERPADLTLAITVIMFFSAAYIAEIVRGGLQAVPKGQTEAGQALGLKPGLIQRSIVLPQALRAVIPAMVGQFISLFKDTSLLYVIGMSEFLKGSDIANTQPEFNGAGLAPVTLSFVAVGFWAISYSMSKESRRLERRLGVGTR